MRKLQNERETITAKNKSLAEYNMSKQRPFADLKNEVGRLYEEVNSMKLKLGKDVATLGSIYYNNY